MAFLDECIEFAGPVWERYVYHAWIEALFGWGLARRAQVFLPNVRWSFTRFWDKTLLRFDNRHRAEPLHVCTERMTLVLRAHNVEHRRRWR